MKIALFAGTFDPPTLGHLEIIQRASSLCDKLYIAVAPNGKNPSPLSQHQRIGFLQTLAKEFPHVEVIPLTGLVVDVAKEHHVHFLVRGLRNVTDLDYEMQMASANRMMTGIETICLLTSPQNSQINSTLIRQIAAHGKSLEGFVPPSIEKKVFESLSSY